MDITRVCFICCNTYVTPKYKLGVGPLNDSITVAANLKMKGFFIYFLHNPKGQKFLDYLTMFLQKTSEHLTVYYTGHGASIPDKNGDESDGLDEVMIFDDGIVVDDKLVELIKKHATGRAKITLLNDCCHSGTIWDLPTDPKKAMKFPPNIVCISAAKDNQTAKQAKQRSNDQGLFTFFVFQEVRRNPNLTPKELQKIISEQLKKYKQTCLITPTRQELMNVPIFPS
ncbi:Clan CD, family C14, metacaspase-like cysteine peptidase [Tritrichomonas foetus]|uniref:Clan CD, family C14, metacaspase-like cysteine peptidase n=1 Tax=Tritrichomonas foetus TaxID=1144522 RepID=A0A1J4KXK0_9EUKA|nr:Clan CD, family C14, metacaspase-like cysteine peptidase [Tritrichomonas foetus]|eukprot:OHT15977.1 Clan CD, family C14, metacaspase-like cysteine peptidase [Tritrichomonas foetus]